MCLVTELNSQMKNQIHYHSIATTKIKPPQILIYNKKYPPGETLCIIQRETAELRQRFSLQGYITLYYV